MMDAMSSTQFNEWQAALTIFKAEKDKDFLDGHANDALANRQRVR